MDHVQDHSSNGGNENYSHELDQPMNSYTVDPSLINQTQWTQPAAQYTDDIFHQQQSYQHPQQQYLQAAPSPYDYGAAHSPIYPNASYPSIYGQQPLRSNSIGQYGVQYTSFPSSSQSPMQSALHPSQHPYTTTQSPFSYSAQGQIPATVSPHDLERAAPYTALVQARNTLTPQPVSSNTANELFRRSWNSELEFQEQPLATSALVTQYGAADSESLRTSSHPSVSHHATISPVPTVSAQPPQPANQAVPPASQPVANISDTTQKNSSTHLRITHTALLAETEDTPARRFPHAPYAVIGVGTVDLDNKYASKALPVWQVRPNRSGKVLVPGLENKISSVPTSRPKKPRAPRVRKYASAKINVNKAERARPISTHIPIGGESITVVRPSLSPAESSSEEEYESSEDESDYTDEEEELGDMRTLEEIRPGPRPSDVAGASGWDALGLIYSPPGRRPTAEEKLKVAMEFHPFVTTLREDLVRVSTDLVKAEAEKRDVDAKALKDERSTRQQALVNALNVAITTAHQDLKDTLATHDKFVVGLTNILRNCIKADDYLGDLALAVFHLMSTFTKASEALLTRSKFDSIVKKFTKNRLESKNVDVEGRRKQEDIKRFTESIMKNTVEAQDRAAMKATEASIKRLEQKEAVASNSMEKEPKPTMTMDSKAVTQSGSGVKRPHEPESTSNVANKKVASESIKNAAVKPSSTKILPIKPSNIFAKLGKQTPKTGTSNASSTTAVKPAVKKPTPVSTGPSTLSMLLADIQKPKEVPKAPEAPKRPAETPEEKAKRERKESRRHLRVHFKEGTELTEVRIFKHERAEDEGRQGDMLRDAHDDRSEGMMHKQRFQGASDIDDDDGETEINEKPWPNLSEIDFSALGQGYYGDPFTTRGGQVQFETPEQRTQSRREETEVMVVYTDVKDIPYSPREAPFEASTPGTEALLRQPTNFPKLQERLLDIRLFGAKATMPRIFRNAEEERLGIHKEMQQRRANEILGITGKPDVVAMLKAIATSPPFQTQNSQPQQPQNTFQQQLTAFAQLQSSTTESNMLPPSIKQPQAGVPSYCPPGMDPVAMANLERVFATKKGLAYPATEAPEWMTPEGKRCWYEDLIKDQIAQAAADKAKSDKAIADSQARLQTATDNTLISQLQRIMTSQPQTSQQSQPQMEIPQQSGFTLPPAANTTAAPASSYDPAELQKVLVSLGYGQNNSAQIQPQSQQQQWQSWAAQLNTNYNVQNPYQQPASNQQGQPPAWQPPAYSQQQQTQQGQPPVWQPPGQVQQQPPAWQPPSYVQQPSWQLPQQADTSHHGQEHTENSGKQTWDNNKFNKNRLDPDYKRNTKPCRFWHEGKCAKGASCTFIHE